MFESIFEFLFKYRPLLFEQGDIALSAPWPVVAILVAGFGIALPALYTYSRARGKSSPTDRRILSGLRIGLLTVLVFCVLQPTLVLSSVLPQRNFLAVLVDNSRSMRIEDDGETPRTDFIQETFSPDDSDLLTALSDKFSLRFFSFSSTTSRVDSPAELTYTGSGTSIGQALDRAREELAGVPLSGMLMLSDGADNSDDVLAQSLIPLQAQGTPVFTVGIGDEVLERDIQIGRVETPRTVMKGASMGVDILVTQSGFDGETVTLQVEDEGIIVSTQEVEFGASGEPTPTRVRFSLADRGPRRLRFRIPPQEGELVTENNARDILIEVLDEREKILYLEGEPRFELKFIRRAIASDENLQVVTLQRTADGKFLRLDVDDGEELIGGFPRTREELFQYRALILGSIEASFFTHDQLQMIADFVGERGGGLLAIGGRNAFAQGGFAGTPVEEALPVILRDAPFQESERYYQELKVTPTRAGALHSALQISDSEQSSEEKWLQLPEVSTSNPISELKPAAVALLTAENPDLAGDDQIVLAYHRYGRGKAAAFPVQDSWLWQMHSDVPLEDLSHETLWQQLLRWLVDGVPNQVMAELPSDRAMPGDAVRVVAEISDSAFAAVNNSQVTASIVGPMPEPIELTLDWTVDEDGKYEASFVPPTEGLYEIDISAGRGDEVLGTASTFIDVSERSQEFFDPGMRSSLLRRVAEETGGRFYTPDELGTLAEDIDYTGAGVTVVEERDLWDMPILLILILGFMGTEWGYRRIRGLA